MPQPIDRAGTFRGEIISFGLQEKEATGTVAIYIKVRIIDYYNRDTEAWEDWTEYDLEAEGYLYIIGKNGAINERQAESFIQHAGWDGQLTSIAEGSWDPDRVSITVKENNYQGSISYRIEWVNDYERKPQGAAGNVDARKAADLQSRFAKCT